jgi:hypothetical protein
MSKEFRDECISESETWAETSCTWGDEEEGSNAIFVFVSPLHQEGSGSSDEQPRQNTRSLLQSKRAWVLLLACLVSMAEIGRLRGSYSTLNTINKTVPFDSSHNKPPTDNSNMDDQDYSPVVPHIRPLSPLARQQAANYRNQTALMINLHITHHAGTTVCNRVGHAPNAVGRTPKHACWIVRNGEDQVTTRDYPKHNPWRADETSHNAAIARQFFHMISWEYEVPPAVPLRDTAWDDPALFSVLVMRDPIQRLLAGDQRVARTYPGVVKGTANRTVVEAYAHDDFFTDNYALRILAGTDCCQGKDTDRKHLEAAKELVQRFSVVINIECLDESLLALAENEWNLTLAPPTQGQPSRAPARERLGDDDIYDYLVEKNKLDIELYEWSKTLSYLDCPRVRPQQGEGR